MHQHIWATFVRQFVCQELVNFAQSGHTGCTQTIVCLEILGIGRLESRKTVWIGNCFLADWRSPRERRKDFEFGIEAERDSSGFIQHFCSQVSSNPFQYIQRHASLNLYQSDRLAKLIFPYLPIFVAMKMCPIAYKISKENSTFCQILSKLSNNCQRLLKCWHFGEISPNLVTLISSLSLSLSLRLSFSLSRLV